MQDHGQKWLEFGLTFPGAYLDHPFDGDWEVLRRRDNGKIFMLVYPAPHEEGGYWLNLKCDPIEGDFYKQAFPAILPGYHMNKVHWLTVKLDGSVPDGEIEHLMEVSYRLTGPKGKKNNVTR